MTIGGAQEGTLDTCAMLLRRPGWEVHLVAGPPTGSEGGLLTTAHRAAVPYTVVSHLRRQINPLRDGLAFVQIVRLLRHIRPDIVQTHSSKAGFLGRFAAHVARVPVIIHTVEALPFHPYAGPAKNALSTLAERWAARITDSIVCVAKTMVDQAIKAQIASAHKFSVIYSGVDIDSFEKAAPMRQKTRRELGLAPDDVVIGKVARLRKLKGHDFLLCAAPVIMRSCPRARFLFVGDGPYRSQLQRKAAVLGLADRVTFTGMVQPQCVPAIMSALDVLVHTSLHEGLPRVLVQALLCNKPVVAYAVDGVPEVVVDGHTGWLVPPGSTEELAHAVLEAISRPDEAFRRAQRGKELVRRLFSIETMANRTEQLYLTLLRNKGVRPVPSQ